MLAQGRGSAAAGGRSPRGSISEGVRARFKR
jgi:hypothetical protein